MPGRSEKDSWHQIAIPCDDHQEFKEIFHIRGSGNVGKTHFSLLNFQIEDNPINFIKQTTLVTVDELMLTKLIQNPLLLS